eukprot:TRINITY_DN11196_c0_g1_i1.p1 TRINITY_DN11196_c0_g1~~TRINITY_DN11196_c0_g1_i1.p1  ORF type:complete len:431 (-),score=123.90 TRINITY_DN11196_c0_g1_i1:61-1353(-)
MAEIDLPAELFGLVFENLEVNHLKDIKLVCKNWNRCVWATRKSIDVSSTETYKANIRDENLVTILQKTRQLQSLNLSETYYLTAEVLKKIAELGLPLKRLQLNGTFDLMGKDTAEANVNIAHLRTLTTLTELQLKWHKFSDEGMQAFENMINMTSLDLTGCEMKGPGFKHLLRMHKLKRLYFSFSPTVTNEALGYVAQLTSLRALEMQYCEHITDEGAAKLSTLTDLTRINFHGCSGITDATIEMVVRSMPNLVQLHLSDCSKITDRAVDMIRGLKNLTGLYMYRCEALTPEALASIASMVDLRELYINRTHVNDNVLDCYQNLVNLRKLCFGMGDPAVTDQGIYCLTSLQNLEWLDCTSARNISNSAMNAIDQLTNLRRLRIGKCPGIGDEAIPHFERLTNLVDLDISETAIRKDVAKERLGWIKQLRV